MIFRNKGEIEPELEKKLISLNKIHVKRDPATVAKNRTAYLAEVEKLAVSKTAQKRLTFQNHILNMIRTGKENIVMSPIVASIVMAIILFFGGSGIGIAAAQTSLPNEVLYPVKLFTEDVKEMLTTQPQEKLNLELDLSQTRLEEIGAVLLNGDTPEEPVFTRLQTHLMTAFELAASTNPNDSGEMLRLQNRLQEQVHIMDQLQTGQNAQGDAILLRTRDMLQTQVRLVDNRLANPASQNTQSPTQNQDQDKTQDQVHDQDTTQTQTQDMIQDQIQDKDLIQNQDMIHDQAPNQPLENNSGNGNSNSFTPTNIPGNNNNGSNSNSGGGGGSNSNGGGGGRK